MNEPRKSVSHVRNWANDRLLSLSMVAVIVESALLALLVFSDIGFDHPGRFGLDFNALIVIGTAYAVALLFGLARSIIEKNWATAVLQICVPIATMAFEFRPVPRYDAAAYQYLKGKSKSEVEVVLGTRGVVGGFEGHPDGDREFAHYKGMTIIYSPQGRVVEIVADSQ
jgi:hypothetical protein